MQSEFANKVLIIGGSAAGAGVAARLRRLDEDAQITIIDKSKVISYATCGIPYFLGNVIKDEDRMRSLSAQDFQRLLNVDVRTGHEVIQIDRRAQVLDIRNNDNGETYQAHYDKLVLATGSRARLPDFSGIEAEHIFTVRGHEDTSDIKRYIHARSCRHALIVGSGLIGLETAENFQRLGMQVTLLDKSNQVLGGWDPEMASVVRRHLRDKKVNVILNEQLREVRGVKARLASGRVIKADIIILALGVEPDISLAKSCGLAIGELGGVAVNPGLVTSDQHIYALGDAVEVIHPTLRQHTLLSLAGPAHKQARIVAENIVGRHVTYRPPHANSIVKVFNLTAAMTGCSETQLIQNKVPYFKSYTESASNAVFYPGAQSMVVKLLFAPDSGRILGAQIVGAAGVDKRIDVFSTAMQAGMSVEDLKELELAYAPPFSSAKDPVNIAGMVASNMLYEDYQVMHWDDLEQQNAEKPVFLDVRTAEEFELRCLPGAIHIPLEELRQRLDEIPENRRIVVYCGYGKKGYFAYKLLRHYGFNDVFNLSGGITVYSMAKLHLVAAQLAKAETETATKPAISSDQTAESLHLQLEVEELVLEETGTAAYLPEQTRIGSNNSKISVIEVDASGLSCPGPIMKLAKTMHDAEQGDIVKITATDNAFASDIRTWCQKKGHRLLEFDDSSATIKAILVKS